MLILVASSPEAVASRCHQAVPLGENLKFQIRSKMQFLNDPRQYCLAEKRQLRAVQAFRDYAADDKDCFVDQVKRRHALQLAEELLVSTRHEVARDCR